MAAYVLQDKPASLLDPALGEGAFFRAAKRYAAGHGFSLELFGRDIDPEIIGKAKAAGLGEDDLRNVEIRDFVLDPPPETFPAIIVNPPYIRHHRISAAQKEQLRIYVTRTTGRHIDARAGLHVYFLIRALQSLSPGGRLAYIVSADICEGVFSATLWQWICSHYRLDAVITFAPEAAPFPEVDTNAIVFFIQNLKPAKTFQWVKCLARDPEALIALSSGKRAADGPSLQVFHRSLAEAMDTGLSRPPAEEAKCKHTLGDFASVMRGIVTGDNEFFFLTSARAKELGIPERMLVRAVGRMRDVQGDRFGQEDLVRLEASGRPTFLLNVNGFSFEQLPEQVRRYLSSGESKGLPSKTLIKTRTPWYRMETRKAPEIMFAYLGRRHARFIRNTAGVVPLTCLLCVYPKDPSPEFVDRLCSVLFHPETIANLKRVGKSYGGDAIKVEPRALERLPLPDRLVKSEGLDQFLTPKQGKLFEAP